MTEKKKKILFIAIMTSIVLFIFFSWYNKEFNSKSFVKFEGEYYFANGAGIYEENITEVVGEVKRKTFRTLWNREGDSNFAEPGARIAKDKSGALNVEMKYEVGNTGEIKSVFFRVHPKK